MWKRFIGILQVGIAFTWAGLVLGLFFIETPFKFRAPGVSTAIGLGQPTRLRRAESRRTRFGWAASRLFNAGQT